MLVGGQVTGEQVTGVGEGQVVGLGRQTVSSMYKGKICHLKL